jgi:hypothetical protein
MAHEADPRRLEGKVAVNVIRMDVGVDDITDGSWAELPDLLFQGESLLRASSAIDDGDAALTDDESDIGDLAPIVLVRQLVDALMNVDTRRNFLEGEFLGSGLARV